MSETPKKRLYFASMPFMNYVFAKGKLAVFKHHRYATDVPEEIEELDKEVAAGHPNIRIDPEMRYLTAEMEDPMKALRARFYAEFMKEKMAQINPENDMGKSEQVAIKPQSTSDVAAVAAGGDATQTAAKLVALAARTAQASRE